MYPFSLNTYCKYFKIWPNFFYYLVICLKCCNRMAKNCRPWSYSCSSFIWVYTVSLGMSVQIFTANKIHPFHNLLLDWFAVSRNLPEVLSPLHLIAKWKLYSSIFEFGTFYNSEIRMSDKNINRMFDSVDVDETARRFMPFYKGRQILHTGSYLHGIWNHSKMGATLKGKNLLPDSFL